MGWRGHSTSLESWIRLGVGGEEGGWSGQEERRPPGRVVRLLMAGQGSVESAEHRHLICNSVVLKHPSLRHWAGLESAWQQVKPPEAAREGGRGHFPETVPACCGRSLDAVAIVVEQVRGVNVTRLEPSAGVYRIA